MEFLVLGPLRVLDTGRPVAIAAPRQRALLAALLVHANEVVSTDKLLDLVWGGDDSEVGVSTLRYHISKLRDVLEPDRESGQDGIISTQAPGYVLHATPGQIDALGFEKLTKEAREVQPTDPAQALKLLDDALSRWQGSPYADFAYEEFARLETLRLEELHLGAMEDRFEALLALGREREIVGELQALTEEHPHRERLTGGLMLALYRSGRQADALAAYQKLRRELGEGLGIEPSKDLVDLEGRILLQDETLAVEAAPPAAEFLRGYVLRGRIGEGAHGIVWRAAQPGVGREVAIKAIHPDIANRPGFVRRFEMEAQLVASLEHPHIVSLFDFWRDPEGAYLVMPHLRGGNLAQLLAQGPLQPDAALELIEAIGGALSYAHRRGVVHRDVTPQNVLLDDEGHPYLADFGVAALIGETGPPTSSSPAYLAPEQHEGRGAVAESDVYSFGVLTHSILTGGIPTVDGPLHPVSSLNPDFPTEVDEVIARATAVDVAERYLDPGDFVAALAASLNGSGSPLRPAVRDLRNPYKGLRAFSEADSPDFFGRDVVVSELIDAVARHRLVAVVGPSGCGKSSLVRAGLIADLRRGALPGSERWLVTDMYPGTRPRSELEEALLRVAVERPTDLFEQLASDDVGAVFGELLPRDAELLLVVDQFEELFTLTTDEEERRRFLAILGRMATDSGSRVRVIVTLRADFYDRPLEFAGFGDLMRRGLVSVTVPNEDSLAQAIVGPAESVGLSVEPGLERVITRDVADQPGGLPLLEFALTELFHQRDGEELTAAGYQRTGGVLGALGRRAEDLFAGYGDAERSAIRQVFLRLVTVEEGTEDTRRRIALTELHEIGIESDTLQRVLDDYGSHRLITFDRDPETRAPTVEVAHEALLSRWDRLRSWIDERRDDLVLHRRLAAAVREWHDSEWKPAYLFSGGRLEHYETFAADTDIALADPERGFLNASRVAEDETLARRRRRRMGVLAAFASAAVIAAVFAVVANQQRGRAEVEASLNRSRVLAAASVDAIGEDDQLALLLGLEAADVSLAANGEVLPEAADALHRSLRACRLEAAVSLDDLPGRTVSLAASSLGLVAVSSTGDTVELRHGDDIGTVVATLGVPLESADATHPSAPAFAPDGRSLAVVGSDGTVRVWDVESGTEIWSQASHGGGRGGVAYSPDGKWLVSGVGTSTVMWDAASGEEIWTAVGGLGALPVFSPDGTRIAGGGWVSAELTVLDAESGVTLAQLRAPTSVGGLLWSPDGTRLFVGLETSNIYVVDTAALGVADTWEGAVVDTWEGHSATPMSMAIDSSSARLATGADDGTVRIWDLATGGELMVLGAGAGSIDSVAFLSGDRLLVAADSDRPLRLYDVSPEGLGEVFAARTGGEIAGIDFSPDGTKLISLTFGGEFTPAGITIWDIATGNPHLTVDGLDWWSFDGVSFTNDGGGFVVQDWDESQEASDAVGDGWGPVQLRDATTGRVLTSFAETEGQNRQTPGFSADGSVLATGSTSAEEDLVKEEQTSTASVHDAATGELLHRLDHEDWAVSAVAPSPNGDRLATATCEKGIVSVWDVASETVLWSTEDPNCYGGIAYSPDGSYVAASGLFDAPTVWDAETGEKRFEIVGHKGGAVSIEISADGSTIASAGLDGSVLVVDATTGESLAVIQVADAAVGDVDFSPDGETLAAATLDGSLFVFARDPERLVDLARSRTLRTFTEAECDAYKIDPCPTLLEE